jgi:DNA-binding response OmpR family regulator
MAKILYVEDNLSLRFVTSDQLKKRGYQVVSCKDGKEALSTFKEQVFDLCILDIMLPEIDGFELAKKIRQENEHIPIIFLSARSMQEDKIEGLKIGGDDYLTKPFDIDELCLKIEVFLKRKEINSGQNNVYKIRDFQLDVTEQTLSILGIEKGLTLKETELLSLLVQKQNTIVKREYILVNLWGRNDYFLGRSLDVFISKLRKKLTQDQNISIENIRGVGFRLNVAS